MRFESETRDLEIRAGVKRLRVNVNPLSANPTKWSNTLKQFVGKLPTNCLSVFDHFVKLALNGLKRRKMMISSKKARIRKEGKFDQNLLKKYRH